MIKSALVAIGMLAGATASASADDIAAEFRTAAMLGCLEVTERGNAFESLAVDLKFTLDDSVTLGPATGKQWRRELEHSRLVVLEHQDASRACSVFLLDVAPGATATELTEFMIGEGAPFALTAIETVDDIRSSYMEWSRGSVSISAVLSEPIPPRDLGVTLIFTVFLADASNADG